MTKFPENFRLVQGQIYAGGAPDQNFLNFFKSTLNGKLIVSLDDGVGKKIKPIVDQLKLKQIIVPVSASDTTYNSHIKYIVENIVNILRNNQPVYIHCLHGSDRTGLALAIYKIKNSGMNPEIAIKEAKKHQYGARISPTVQKSWNDIIFNVAGKKQPDVNSADAIIDYKVIEENNQFDVGNDISSYQMLGSWGPADSIFNITNISDNLEQKRYNRIRKLQEIARDANIPPVGQLDMTGMRGAGPVENTGILDFYT